MKASEKSIHPLQAVVELKRQIMKEKLLSSNFQRSTI